VEVLYLLLVLLIDFKLKNMAEKFKPHMMYAKSGKGIMANTYKKHLELKKKGYGHKKPKTNKK